MKHLFSGLADALLRAPAKPRKKHYTVAMILAGGCSTRMGGTVTKQMLSLRDKPLILHTLEAFQNASSIDEILVVAKAEEKEVYMSLAEAYGITKLHNVVVGGDTRQKSAENGFDTLPDTVDFVAIHDGARCLVTPDTIDKVCLCAWTYMAATAALRCTETVKIESDGRIRETLDRDHVFLARTPQVFRTDLYRAALEIGKKDGVTVTDDCSLLEHIGFRVRLVECPPDNIKITTPLDLPYAESILAAREEAKENTL